jgi:methionyl-tRNA synthetase
MTIDEFGMYDFRIGKIISVNRVEGSEKLLNLGVDIGEPVPRQILSGVAKVYTSEDILGKRVIVVANLDPKIMAGVESRGMLLGIERGGDGAPLLIFPENDIAPGAKIS